MVGAWSTFDPIKVEQGIGTDLPQDTAKLNTPVATGLFLADFESEQTENGDVFLYSELLNGESEILAGTISELHADENIVLASKQGLSSLMAQSEGGSGFVNALQSEIKKSQNAMEVILKMKMVNY